MKKLRKWRIGLILGAFSVLFLAGFDLQAEAKDGDTIKSGIYAGDINLSGMSQDEARGAIEDYINGLRSVRITLLAANNNEVQVTAGDLGISWGNPGLVEEALQIGTKGNVIQRYKILKDLEHSNLIYDIELRFSVGAINDILAKECAQYDQDAVNHILKKENESFNIIEGRIGYKLDIEASIDMVYDYLMTQWEREACAVPLVIAVQEPAGSKEELALVTDVLGTFTTSYSSSSANRSANVKNGCQLVDGATLYPGEEYSTYNAVYPFTESNGYYMAPSYLNGRVIDSLGGGICQVSTTLYNAVLRAELDVTERHCHSMVVTYVDRSADAAIAESAGKDFRFINNTGYPIYIEGYVLNKNITFTIYGHETRSSDRKVTYTSEILETTHPETDAIYPDAAQPIGYIITEGAHIGYKARLWKVVTENGVEVSRTEVNSSSYKMTPRIAHVGTATGDPQAYEEIMAAIGTGSIDHVKNVINILVGNPQPPSGEQPPEGQ